MANVLSRIGATVGRIFAKKPGYSLTRGGRSNPLPPETKTEDAMMAGRKRLEVIAGQKWEDMWISKPDVSRLMTEV